MQLFASPSQVTGRALPAALFAVATGGAVGATLRWALGETSDVAVGSWPWPTFVANVVGCLLIGVAAIRLERGTLWWDAVVTGLLGGFTTMSSFAVELNNMVDLERTTLAIGYGATTLAAGIAAVAVGTALASTTRPPRTETT